MAQFTKAVGAKLDYGFDWSDWLQDGETISTSTWTVPSGLTEVSDSNDATGTKVWISGGTDREIYTITNKIVTTDNREDTRSHVISVEER